MKENIDQLCLRLRHLLTEAVKRNLAEGILLSGGLDTSVLAVIASRLTSLRAFTVAFQEAPAPDVEYAILVAKYLGLRHQVHRFDKDELWEAIPRVVKIMKSFDPMEVRNSVAIYIGLKAAKEDGINTVMTGDGCDELLAGYSFLYSLGEEKLKLELQKLWSVMVFSSVPLAEALGIGARLPYLDPEFKAFAIELAPRYLVRTEKGRKWGKWILRKAFEGLLPKEVAWRIKVPIEGGSGTSMLSKMFSSIISDAEFEEERRKFLEEDRITIRDKEQLFYYGFYRHLLGAPHPSDPKGRVCPQCNSNIAEKATYCRTCGAYPI